MDERMILLFYLVLINIVGFLMMAVDKRRAKQGKWRIPERRLMLYAAFGGSIGSLLGMKKFHHKTKHKKFYIGIPMILIAQIAGGIAIWIWSLK